MLHTNEEKLFLQHARWELQRRDIFERGFEAFCNAFGFQLAPHHKLLAQKLERLITEPGYQVMVFWPPGHAKTTYTSVLFPAYYMGRFPFKNVIMGTHTDDLSEDCGRACRRIIEEPQYNFYFRTALRQDSRSVARFELVNGSKYYGYGMVSGSVTGRRADLGIIDDPLKGIEAADSETIRNKIWGSYLYDFTTRTKGHMSKALIMTRWHDDDLAGRILRSPAAANWDILCLPALATENDPLGREVGDPLWPDQFSLETLIGMRNSLNKEDLRMWESLYQQNPTIETGDYFQREWIQLVNRVPDDLQIFGGSDYAVTEKKGDFTVHAVVGYDQVNDDIYILNVWRKQTESDVWVDSFLDLCALHKPAKWAEEHGQIIKGVGPFIDKEMSVRKVFVLRQQYTSTTDKQHRARSIQAYFARKKVFILNADWTDKFVKELLGFPSGLHDDQVDAIALIGRMLSDMYLKPIIAEHKRIDDFRSNIIRLPGLDDDISGPSTRKRI